MSTCFPCEQNILDLWCKVMVYSDGWRREMSSRVCVQTKPQTSCLIIFGSHLDVYEGIIVTMVITVHKNVFQFEISVNNI